MTTPMMRNAASAELALPSEQTALQAATSDHVRVRSFVITIKAGARPNLSFVPEPEQAAASDPGSRARRTLILGDDSDWPLSGDAECLGNAVSIRLDARVGTTEILSSVTGLPPVFVGRFPDRTIVTSEISQVAGGAPSADLDAAAVLDLFQIGYPTGYRTLFRDVSILPGGHRLRIGHLGQMTVAPAWALPVSQPLDWPSYLELQAEEFTAAVRRIDLSDSFLSLTGGLDTRTILAALVAGGRSLPAATLTGPRLSLDAIQAGRLCEAYELRHHVIRLDSDFLRDLPTYMLQASRLSGGLNSLEQAGEIYFYQQLSGVAHRRLCGRLGNQTCRQGFETLSVRNADVSVLSPELAGSGEPGVPCKSLPQSGDTWYATFVRLIQDEATLSSLGNFCIGQHFATQQSPYSSRAMIECLGSSPMGPEQVGTFSMSRARMRDLQHRFLGEPRKRSFQRALIARVGGHVARYPVNWGWRVDWGVSPAGLGWGVLALADAAIARRDPVSRALGILTRLTGTAGIQNIQPHQSWLSGLRSFVHDTLFSQASRESGVFDPIRLSTVLDEHYRLERCRYGTIVAALDLALARQLLSRA